MYIKTVMKFAVAALLALVASLSTQAIAQTSTAPSGPITYLQNDLTGNVILATDASGATVWDERYLPYGGKRLGTSSSQKYGYHQKALDPETGLQYFGARYYDPLSGRFSGMDPLAPTEANIHTFNRYGFANGNPYRYTDPDGKVVIDIVFVAYDIYKLTTEGATTTNLVATGLDVASTFGFGFGAGTIFRAARVAEHAAEGARTIEEGVNVGKEVVSQGHHSLPKFLGGDAKQALSKISSDAHKELHAELRANLKEAGIPLNVGGKGGSAADWTRYMNANPGAQRKAFDAVLDASRTIDLKHGTSITQDVWRNIIENKFTAFP